MKHKTDELIQGLADDLKSQKSYSSFTGFMVRWGLVAALFLALFCVAVPLRGDLSERKLEARFWIETAVWFLGAAIAAALTYRSAIPSLLKKGEQKWGAIAIAALVALLSYRLSRAEWAADLSVEMTLYRGGCGIIIFFLGLSGGAALFAWARRAAPTRLRVTGFWAAISAGCLGSGAMQLFCPQDNALHIWVWHGIPVLILAVAGAQIAHYGLRWGGMPDPLKTQ